MSQDNDPQQMQAQAHELLRESTRLMLQLGDIAASSIPQYDMAHTQEVDDEKQKKAERQPQLDQDEKAKGFLDSLPTASTTDVAVTESLKQIGLVVKTDDIKTSLMADATILWVPAPAYRKYKPRLVHGFESWAVETGSLLHADIMVPTFVIGRKLDGVNQSQTDAVSSVLLAPAFELHQDSEVVRPEVFTARVSSRALDKLDEMAITKLTTPLTEEEYEARQNGGQFGFRTPEPLNAEKPKVPRNNGQFGTWFKSSVKRAHLLSDRHARVQAEDLPYIPAEEAGNNEPSQEVKKLIEHLSKKGIDMSVGDPILLTSQTLYDYNVAMYAEKLALIFNAEDAFKQTIGAVLESDASSRLV
jgi:hypothetical protein